jgi:RNA polymerase sigma-70 factor (ECF subfamily)
LNSLPCPDDSQLARQAREGSSAAFGTLVHRYHPRVYAFLLTLTRHRQDAEDLTQETFVRAWKKIRRYDPDQPLLPWLFTMARRLSIAALRKRRPLPPDLPPPQESASESPAFWLWGVARRELAPEAYSALWLHYRDELPLKEVAGILGKREGAVKVMLHRARKSLAAKLRARIPPPLPQLQRTP